MLSNTTLSLAIAIAAAAFGTAPVKARSSQELPRRAALGVSLAAASEGTSGARVIEVLPRLTGEKIGVRVGDVIVRAGGRPVADVAAAIAYASQLVAGDRVDLVVRRNGREQKLSGRGIAKPLEAYANATIDYGAVRFRDGLLRDILAKPIGVSDPPVVFLLPGFTCASIEPPSPSHPYRRLGEELLRAGIAYYRVEKPGVGDSAGGPLCRDIDYAAELDAFRSAYRHLVDARGFDPDRIFMFGHSLGGLEAPMLAAERPPRGVAVFGTVYRNWADYHHNVFAFQPFLMAGEDPVQTAQQSERLRNMLERFYFGRQSPSQIASEVPAFAQPLRETISWNGSDLALGRHYKFMQDLAHQNLPAAWRDTRSNVLSLYGESDIVAVYDEDHKLIAEVANHYRPGTGRYMEVAKTDHGMTVVGDRTEFRRQTVNQGEPPQGPFNTDVTRILAEWIRDSMAKPPVRSLPERQSSSPARS